MEFISVDRRKVSAGEAWSLLDLDRELMVTTSWPPLREALAALPRLVSPPNSIASLISPTGETLSIGIAGASDTDNPNLGSPLASIEYIPTDLSPPYRLVVGDPDLSFDRGGVVVFRFEGQWTEILRRNCVPVGTMIRVVEDFHLSGRLPDWIAWEDA